MEETPALQFYGILALYDSSGFYEPYPSESIFKPAWRPLNVYVKGVRDTRPAPPQGVSTDIIGVDSEICEEKEFLCELIRRLSPANATVVDPFMNKGIVGQAALELGRTYVGIERETTRYLTAMDLLYSNYPESE